MDNGCYHFIIFGLSYHIVNYFKNNKPNNYEKNIQL